MIPAVEPFLSLKQTKSFTYLALDGAHAAASDAYRRIVRTPVDLDSVVLDLRGVGNSSLPRSFTIDLHRVLRSINPRQLHVLASPTARHRYGAFLDLSSPRAWSQLQEITFTHAFAGRALCGESYLEHRSPLLDLVYDFSDRVGTEEIRLRAVLECIRNDLGYGLGTRREEPRAFGHVQVWLHDEDEVVLAETILLDCDCESLEIGVKESVPLAYIS